MQLVFDTNVLVDAALYRGQYYNYTLDLLEAVEGGKVEGWIAYYTLPTMVYIVTQTLQREVHNQKESRRLALELSEEITRYLQILPQTGQEAKTTLTSKPFDYEDRLIARAAGSFLPAPLIVSRDKHFDAEGVPVEHPAEIVRCGIHEQRSSDEIPFIDLQRQKRHAFTQIEGGIHTVIRHGKFIMGPEVKELEEKLTTFAGMKHCIGCASGTDALLMALMAMGVGPGDAVFTTPFTFIATAEVIVLLGAIPVFVDIDRETFNIDPDKLRLAVRAVKDSDPSIHPLATHSRLKARGVIPVDLFGLPCDYDPITEITSGDGLFIIEDAAQALGAEYKGRNACSLGDIGCTSFFPAKPLGCYGDGGAVFTDDDDVAAGLRSIGVHGKGDHKYDNIRIGLNARLDTLQAAVLLPKLDIFPHELDKRQEIALGYSEYLSVLNDSFVTPSVPSGLRSSWAQYSVLAGDTEKRSAIQSGLRKNGIPTAIYYPRPLHLQTAFAHLGYQEGDFPVAEEMSARIFSLPMHPYLELKEVQRICHYMGKIQEG